MDEAVIESLSRYLDGDLGAADAEKLEKRLRSDPDLAAELAALQDLRDSLLALAEREEPPSKLDALMEPLRRAAPERSGQRPWVRWLAAAAVAMLGLTVVLEVNRRYSAPSLEKHDQPPARTRAQEPTERFALAPLPTSSVPEEEQLLGASDRLLASPIPEPDFDDLPPLDVIGPLEAGEIETEETLQRSNVPMEDSQPGIGTSKRREKDSEFAGAGASRPQPPESEKKRQPGRREDVAVGSLSQKAGKEAAPLPWNDEKKTGSAQLFVFINGETAWQEFTPQVYCPPGRYSVRVEIVAGVVKEAWPLGGASSSSPSQRLCSGELVLGVEIKDAPDGQYQAEVVVERLSAN
jgi:hypothetical protein